MFENARQGVHNRTVPRRRRPAGAGRASAKCRVRQSTRQLVGDETSSGDDRGRSQGGAAEAGGSGRSKPSAYCPGWVGDATRAGDGSSDRGARWRQRETATTSPEPFRETQSPTAGLGRLRRRPTQLSRAASESPSLLQDFSLLDSSTKSPLYIVPALCHGAGTSKIAKCENALGGPQGGPRGYLGVRPASASLPAPLPTQPRPAVSVFSGF